MLFCLQNHECFTNFKDNFTKIVRNEINRLAEDPTKAYYVSASEIVKFVHYSKTSSQIINEDDAINRGLLELLEAIENRSIQNTENVNQMQSEPMKSSRRKRSVKEVDSQIEKINLELQVLERLIESKNASESVNAMKRLLDKVKTIVTRLCNDSSFTYANFSETSFLLKR